MYIDVQKHCHYGCNETKNVVIARCGFHRGDPLGECFVYTKSFDTKWIASSQAPRNDVVVCLRQGSEILISTHP